MNKVTGFCGGAGTLIVCFCNSACLKFSMCLVVCGENLPHAATTPMDGKGLYFHSLWHGQTRPGCLPSAPDENVSLPEKLEWDLHSLLSLPFSCFALDGESDRRYGPQRSGTGKLSCKQGQ